MTPQASIDTYLALTEAERRVVQNVEYGDYGVREYARETGRAPGTVGNLLSRARDKLGSQEAK